MANNGFATGISKEGDKLLLWELKRRKADHEE